jgi:hypothetical protein
LRLQINVSVKVIHDSPHAAKQVCDPVGEPLIAGKSLPARILALLLANIHRHSLPYDGR